ncbi:MAG: hypothetical protein H6P98_360, partial [Candidatus Aminicenantes bacterium]|nr:hypothetical protein [Candidatus Aminicenantes bacterium]
MQTIPLLFLHLTDTFKKPALLHYKKDGAYVSLTTDEVRTEVERI